MNKRVDKDNLYDNKLKITIYSESRDKTKVIEYFIILIGVMSTMLTITTGLSWHDVYEQLIIIESIIITFIMCILFEQKKKVNIIISILLLVIGIINIHKIISSFVKVISNYDKYYVSEAALVVGICSMILAFFITFIVKKKPRIILALIVTLPFLLIVTLCGSLPSNVSFSMLIAFWVSILAMKVKKKKEHTNREIVEKNNAIVGITVIIITFIITIGITKVFTEEDYDVFSSDISYVYNNIDYFLENMSLENFKNIFKDDTVASGGISGGELGNISKLEYDKEADLIVNLPVDGNLNKNIYLRGYIGGEYMSDGWIEVSDNDYKELQDKLDNAGLSGNILQNINSSEISEANTSEGNKDEILNYKGEIHIHNIDANKEYAYLPYDSIYTNDYTYLKDLQCSAGEQEKYSVEYYNYEADIDTVERAFADKGTGYDKNVDKLEEIYRDYVYEVYTRLPSKTLQDIKKQYKGLSESNSMSLCIDIAKDVVLDGTRYDLNPGILPGGKDFVEYFLNENKKGYCVHFATAGAVILRAMGIPARYVEGYVINPQDFEDVSMFLGGGNIEYNVSDVTILNSMSLEMLDSSLVEDIDKSSINDQDSALFNIDGNIIQLIIHQGTPINDVEDLYKKTGDNTFRFMKVNYKIEDFKIEREDEIDYDSIFSGDKSTIVNSQNAELTLTDERAHAWVEVYIDGYGWYPVEFTPSSAYSTDNRDKKDDNNTNLNSETDNGEDEDHTEKQSKVEETDKQSNATYSSPKDNTLVRSIRIVIIVLVLIISISTLVIIIKRILYIHKNKAMEKNTDKNKAIIYFYDQLVKAIELYLGEKIIIDSYKEFAKNIENRIEFIDTESFNKLTDILLKAKYSNKQINRGELEFCIKISLKIKQEIYYRLPKIKSLWYKYIKKCI